ncbi:MAG TPA: hypothetical protein DCX25_04320 [Candidatus Pacebacteria bacterium]|nr:MAG: hypothetical protein UX00_C0007G0023 [Microgenomates group bacterium GW2011_GWB1_45_17]KKU23537.1 MAG: hypothetical protein UX35_C0005G0039 [Microgenomates group bacterium GW2011_GWA1_46_15]KKU24422.1 MAG: hypothetical protein UX36_C0001G0039 [Microgenomates group bacterium GW2011_GWC1_46_15]HAV15528.1 hypothetical protein [Candidatus Paceibacterota bacterium]HCR10853.1 hypothetical protein [Candidatus Paceibacterota bacterium]
MNLLAAVNLKEKFLLNKTQTVADTFGTPAAFINTLLPNAYIAAGLIVFALLVFGGFSIISSGGDPKGLEKGTQAITGAVIGFLVIFASYWIIQIIQIVTGLQILSF